MVQREADRGASAVPWGLVVAVLLLLVTGGLVVGAVRDAGGGGGGDAGDPPAGASPAAPAAPPSPTPTPTLPAVFTLAAAGDVLLHTSVIASARTADGYDFGPLFAPVRPWVAGADLALCHLEVPVAPAGTAPSGYPSFAAPPELAHGLAGQGWDGCSIASNHSFDRGLPGVVATLEAFDDAGLGHVGTARNAEEAAQPQLYRLERGGQTVEVAHLSATSFVNGLPAPPAEAPWAVTFVETAALVEQARVARAAGADVVVASIHCCVEYVAEPTAEQERIAQELAASGEIDLLLGHHAHVPQPVRLLPGGPRGEGMWTAYGLGNFISNQDAQCCSPRTDSGVLLTATFVKPVDGPARVEGVQWAAMTVDRAAGHRVEPLSALVAAGAAAGSLPPADLVARHARVAEVVAGEAPERVAPPEPTGPEPVVVPRSPDGG